MTNTGIILRYLIEAEDGLGEIEDYFYLGGKLPNDLETHLQRIEIRIATIRRLAQSAPVDAISRIEFDFFINGGYDNPAVSEDKDSQENKDGHENT